MYSIKEAYYTLQGEGYHTGRPAVFCRFSGCNLWSGLEKDRSTAICQFCDTNFWGTDGENGGKYKDGELVDLCLSLWPDSDMQPFVVCTGGEPLLQMDDELIRTFHSRGFTIAIESNGTLAVPDGIDWVCISPKAGSELIVTQGDELKLVHPQQGQSPQQFENLDFKYFSLQPLDDVNQSQNTQECVTYCHEHPKWNLSLQTHKILGLK